MIDLTQINARLNQLEQNVINIPVIPTDLNKKWSGIKNDVITSKQDIRDLK
jgi:hypothetical protein